MLTGAGISSASGVPTFRGENGLWNDFKVEDLATPEAFERDPCLVWRWYDERRESTARCVPNAAHHALARFAASRDGVTIVTQNVDGLHDAAARALPAELPAHARMRALPLSLHGTLFGVRCSRCEYREKTSERVDATSVNTLPRCSCGALLRPDVVWFGEMLPERELARALGATENPQVCLSVGTSALVHPAAALAEQAVRNGAALVEVDPQATMLSSIATIAIRQDAAVALPIILGSDSPAEA